MNLRNMILVGAALLTTTAVAAESRGTPAGPGRIPSAVRVARHYFGDGLDLLPQCKNGSAKPESVYNAPVQGSRMTAPITSYDQGPKLIAPSINRKSLNRQPIRMDAYPAPFKEPVRR